MKYHLVKVYSISDFKDPTDTLLVSEKNLKGFIETSGLKPVTPTPLQSKNISIYNDVTCVVIIENTPLKTATSLFLKKKKTISKDKAIKASTKATRQLSNQSNHRKLNKLLK